MKSIVIRPENAARIDDVINQAEGRATVRLISADTVARCVEMINDRLAGVQKKALVGVKASVDYHAQHFPNAYKYTPESTQFGMTRTSSGWRLDWVERKPCRAPSKAVALTLTEEAKAAIIAATESFGL